MERTLSVISLKELNVMKMKMRVSEKIAFKGKTKNGTESNHTSYWNSVYYLVILVISIIPTSLLTVFPRHNSIAYPNKWYEMFIIYILFFGASVTFKQVVEVVMYLNVKSLASASIIFQHLLRELIAYTVPYLMFYLIWAVGFHYNHPMPFIALSGGMLSWGLQPILIWFLLPSHLKMQKDFRKKVWFYILYQVVWMMIHLQLNVLLSIFQMLPVNLQWLMAILIPSFRLLDEWLLSKVVYKMAGDDCDNAKVLLSTAVLMKFGLYVAILLASASDLTVWCILVVDLILHLKSCFQIAGQKKKVEIGNTELKIKMENDIKHLVLSEIIGSLVPLSYAMSFATAYYGPNATLIGNVRCNYFDFKEIEDVNYLFSTMIQMFGVDIGGVMITGVTLWVLCKVNIFEEFCNIMKEYWFILALMLSEGFFQDFAQKDINVGFDFTFQFNWITEEGRMRLIENATDLSDYEKSLLLKNETLPQMNIW